MTSVVGGKRAGAKAKRQLRPALFLLAIGITFAVIAWGYLVMAAIDFGASARHDGETVAWLYLAVASVGAMLCLFLGFMLVVRFARALGLVASPDPRPQRDPALPRGGKRAAR